MPQTNQIEILAHAIGSTADKKKLTEPGLAYKRQVFIVFAGLLLFWIVYFALVAATVWGIYLLYAFPPFGDAIMINIGILATGAMFLIFMLKFLFKKSGDDDKSMIEITEQEHPNLFAFLRVLSKDIGTSFPGKVYVNHEINARVFYQNPLLSLFLPTNKNLLIGLGLVNSLNLTELKAVIAHEFGHFSQGSMRLGSYVYMANRIIYDMVYSRDSWDLWLDRWRTSDFRLAFFAWLLTPFVWLVRMLLHGLYRGLNLLQSSLSRQMEFHADRVAVYAAGSSSIVHALYRLESAGEAYAFAINQIKSGFDHHLYSDNLFYHQREAQKFLSTHFPEYQGKMLDSVKDSRKEKEAYLFSKSDIKLADMYASHPANYLREVNAKSFFLPMVEDNRSAWILFDNAEVLSQKVSKHVLLNLLGLAKDTVFQAAEKVQQFIDEELRELTFNKKYQDYYGNRYLSPVSPEDVLRINAKLGLDNPKNLFEVLHNLYGEDFNSELKQIQVEEIRFAELMSLAEQSNKGNVEYKGKTYTQPALKKELESLKLRENVRSDWYAERDARVFTIYLELLRSLEMPEEEFLNRYQFHWSLQSIHLMIFKNYELFIFQIREIMKKNGLKPEEVTFYAKKLSDTYQNIYSALHEAAKLDLPELSNMENVENLADFLCPEGLPILSNLSIEGVSIQKFDIKVQEVMGRSARILRKNLGRILAVQEKIEEEFKTLYL
jgi:Zn-dependent protease with chaperone function